MKKLLLLLPATLFVISASAQSAGNNNHTAASSFSIPSITTDVWGADTDPYLVGYMKVKNNAGGAKTVNLEKIVIDTVPGTTNSFCWGQYCWPDNVYLSPSPQVIPAGVSDSTFRGDYNIFGKVGTSHMRYLFTDKSNGSDSISVVIAYHVTPTGIASNSNIESKLNASPNPANGMTFIGTSLAPSVQKASIVIHNMLGAKVEEISLNNKEIGVLLVTEGYQSGIYFFSLITDGKTVATKKLVVSH